MLYTIQNAQLTVTIKSLGAELQSIRGANGVEYLWQGDPKYWKDRALNIFPYVARLTNGQYEMDGRRYSLPIHGLAPTKEFVVTEQTADKIVFTFTSDEASYVHYPRNFIFHIIYTLEGNVLKITFHVENKDERTMYFGIGGHPGFNVPLDASKRFTDYRIRFNEPCAPRSIGLTPACFLDGTDAPYTLDEGNVIPLAHSLFDHDAIVLKNMARSVTIEADDGPSVTVRFPGMPYLGIWHMPHTDAPYVCIEPWCSLPSTQDKIAVFEEQEDLISLDAGKVYENVWEIELN